MDPIKTADFSAIRLRVASPNIIRAWSFGEVTKPETINYRTQKPEKDGLFCERIFGPSKDWECYCGKYKKIRYKGIICDKCGVEVTRSLVRRERMGHIELAAPVSHIWFLRGVPSKIGLVLDISIQNLEKVVYFANFIITEVDEELKQKTFEQLNQEYKQKVKSIEDEHQKKYEEVKKHKGPEEEKEDQWKRLREMRDEKLKELQEIFHIAQNELREIQLRRILSESAYQDLSMKYGHVFTAQIGAEAIYALLKQVDVEKTIGSLGKEFKSFQGAKEEKSVRRLKLLKNLQFNHIKPEWMVLVNLPVLPPDLRPMVPLDGGRFATSDLNDLYRRVINRNNRLKQLLELNAPEVICRNEKRMLQEAVDSLIDNSARHGKTVTASTGQKRMLKSIADMLKGKQGRFRQNLLGKRIDYSGRSVIVVGPTLKLHQCGLPKTMALELFKPFVISRLIQRGLVHNVKSASRVIESGRDEVWDILEEIIQDAYVLLNRAPTLHRLGIQAFQPVLIEGKAIRIHPLVCAAFNADFDGDQMAVHVPLTEQAKIEARDLMLSTKNLLKPATGDPVVTPSQDIVWGSFYMTYCPDEEVDQKTVKYFSSPEEALLAYESERVLLQEAIMVRFTKKKKGGDSEMKQTTVGRILFCQLLGNKIPYQNNVILRKDLKSLVSQFLEIYGREKTVEFLDNLKEITFRYLTKSGLSWGMNDLPNLSGKEALLKKVEDEVEETQQQYEMGLLTEEERYSKIIELWSSAKEQIVQMSRHVLDKKSSVYSMIESGARGTWAQFTQIIGMKGLVANPAGKIIELPVKGSFKEGFDVLEYFISTHGSRKGLSDTALRTASAGYLTRRLIDVAQDVIIRSKDCHDTKGVVITRQECEAIGKTLESRALGRVLAAPLYHPKTKKTVIDAGILITRNLSKKIKELEIEEITLRSTLTCKAVSGVCQMCYGWDLGKNELVSFGTAVGIIAAQSIGEPGTQLTMRTFHTGGVAGGQDITQGLPRVEELLEVRAPKRNAFISEGDGTVEIIQEQRTITDASGKVIMSTAFGQKTLRIHQTRIEEDEYKGKIKSVELKVREGDEVEADAVLFLTKKGGGMRAKRKGKVKIENDRIKIIVEAKEIKEFITPPGQGLLVKDGDHVRQGDQLTEGSVDLHVLYRLKGKLAVQKYIIREMQYIYSSQGQDLNDKHIEIIVRQIFSKLYIKNSGDSRLLLGDVVDASEFIEANNEALKKKQKPAEAEELILGITRVSLSTKSFLSAASFIETARVLINAAISGKVDKLEGLKENVIIGRLIPAGTGFRGPQHDEENA